MIQAKCIQKFRDKNNHIYGYRLQDTQGNTKDVTPDKLKTAIKNQQIKIINLTLTSDNRLVDTTPAQQTQSKQNQQSLKISEEQKIKNLIAKSKHLGLLVTEIPTACNHKCYLISKSSTQHIVYIPDDVIKLNEIDYEEKNLAEDTLCFTNYIQNLQGTIKIIGGKNLQDIQYMFRGCIAQFLDFSSFDTSNVTNMEGMFNGCETQSIDLRNLNTSKVTNMCKMFYYCYAQFIDFSNFDTSNVTNMHHMFFECHAQSLDLSSFDTSNVTNMEGMFGICRAQSINISSFDTSNVTKMGGMFYSCQAQSLDLSSFDTSNVTNMEGMFKECYAKFIDISSFDTSNATNIWGMFRYCEAQINATDPKILKEYQERNN